MKNRPKHYDHITINFSPIQKKLNNSLLIQRLRVYDLSEAMLGTVGNTDDGREFHKRLVLGI